MELQLKDIVHIVSTYCQSVAENGEIIGYDLYFVYEDMTMERYNW